MTIVAGVVRNGKRRKVLLRLALRRALKVLFAPNSFGCLFSRVYLGGLLLLFLPVKSFSASDEHAFAFPSSASH